MREATLLSRRKGVSYRKSTASVQAGALSRFLSVPLMTGIQERRPFEGSHWQQTTKIEMSWTNCSASPRQTLQPENLESLRGPFLVKEEICSKLAQVL